MKTFNEFLNEAKSYKLYDNDLEEFVSKYGDKELKKVCKVAEDFESNGDTDDFLSDWGDVKDFTLTKYAEESGINWYYCKKGMENEILDPNSLEREFTIIERGAYRDRMVERIDDKNGNVLFVAIRQSFLLEQLKACRFGSACFFNAVKQIIKVK